jgi:exopolysaccharide biosynthesis polyprenyl glycosylphosphotransferase
MSSTAGLVCAGTSRTGVSEFGRHSEWLLPAIEKLLDVGALMASMYAADLFYRILEPQPAISHSPATTLVYAACFALLFVFLLERHGGYRPCVSLLAIRDTERILRVTLQTVAAAVVATYVLRGAVAPLAFGFLLVLAPLLVTLEKWETHYLLRVLRRRGHGTRRAVILGTGMAARRIYTALVRSPKFGVEPVAFVDESGNDTPSQIFECAYERKHSATVIHRRLCPELFRQLGASILIVADSALDGESMLLASSKAADGGASTYFAAGEFVESGYWIDYADLDGIMLGQVTRGTKRVLYESGKRCLDLLIAGVALALFAPIAVTVAILIKTSSPGPVLFRQERIGKDGCAFHMFKFRSMYHDVPPYGYSPRAQRDPRITPVGRFLRRSSLDELPQLLNVFLGQMSIVGPRPEMPFIVEQYTPLQRQRLVVKPGMTGLWQISADRAFLIHENLEYDLYYVRRRSLFMDIAILLHTFLHAAHGI